jgi:hypothetical protein
MDLARPAETVACRRQALIHSRNAARSRELQVALQPGKKGAKKTAPIDTLCLHAGGHSVPCFYARLPRIFIFSTAQGTQRGLRRIP